MSNKWMNLRRHCLSYEDGYHYQNILAPLVKMEADYDRQIKESLTEDNVSVRWDTVLSGKKVAIFSIADGTIPHHGG